MLIKLENLIGLTITQIYGKKFDGNTTGFIEIVIQLSEYYLHMTVNDDTDELIVQILLSQLETNSYFIPDWANNFISKPLMQCWGIENEKGYSDMICLGIDEVIPSIVLSALASEIKVGLVNYGK